MVVPCMSYVNYSMYKSAFLPLTNKIQHQTKGQVTVGHDKAVKEESFFMQAFSFLNKRVTLDKQGIDDSAN